MSIPFFDKRIGCAADRLPGLDNVQSLVVFFMASLSYILDFFRQATLGVFKSASFPRSWTPPCVSIISASLDPHLP